MTQRIPENFSAAESRLVAIMRNTMPPRDPNDDDDDDEEEDTDTEPDDERQPPVVREPQASKRWLAVKGSGRGCRRTINIPAPRWW